MESGFKGKSMKVVASDIADGLTSINPLFLKKFDTDMIKTLNEHLNKTMNTVRNEKVEFSTPSCSETET